MGRPSSYTPEIAERICDLLASGQSLRSICGLDDMPHHVTVWRWLEANEAFRSQYARAREAQAEYYAAQVVDIALESPIKRTVPSPDGGSDECIDSAGEQWRKTKIDALKWAAGKLKPKVYGEKVQQEVTGEGGAPIKVIIERQGYGGGTKE